MRTCPSCTRHFIDVQTVCPLDDTRLGESDDLGDLAFLGGSAVKLGRVLGNYRLIGVLGEGAMGTVYVAAHTRLERYVAIKMMRAELAARRDSAPRFFDEARTINRIEHPNIVESIDVVEDAMHGTYSVLELLHGPDLRTVLLKGRVPLASAVRVGAQIADALAAVHAIDIVHRDLKPDNMILIERDGRDDFVKLIDFGVSKVGDGPNIATGTAAYMAPEQAAGADVDGRADLYALGVLLFEMATGRHPFPSRTDDEFIMRHAGDPVPRPSSIDPRIPAELDAVILRCLAKSPDDRFATAAEVVAALRAIDIAPTAPVAPGRLGARRRLAIAVAIGALAGIVAIVAIVATGGKPEPPAVRAAIAAPPPAPPPPPRPTQPVEATWVTINFDSTPSGAQVFRAGETVPLGTTPFGTSFARTAQPTRVRFVLANHDETELDVALDSSHDAAVVLAPQQHRPVVAPTRPKKPPHVQREGVMDPFAK